MSGAPENAVIPIWILKYKDPDGEETLSYWLSLEAVQRQSCVLLIGSLHNSEWGDFSDEIEEILKLINRGDYVAALECGKKVWEAEQTAEQIEIESTSAADATRVPLWQTFSHFRKEFEESQEDEDEEGEDEDDEGDDGEAA